ncbi:MAG: hypothetical protein MUO34_08525 [Ignavibacteriaceae bacterium]|nr:hypothetical protein [Ignavibacteriaceae bacterium]
MKTGEALYDNLCYKDEVSELFDIEIQIIKNKEGLLKYFEILEYEIATEGIMPLLQLEMHGDETGIQLSSLEIICWSEIIEYFERFNIPSRNNLIVSLALCNGGHILSALKHHITKRAPFAALIYTFEEVTNIEIYEGFPKFYNSLLEGEDVSVALKQLNILIEDETKQFSWISCAFLLKESFKYYLAEYSSSKTRNEVLNKSLDNFREYNSGIDFNVNFVRKVFKEKIKPENQGDFFEIVKTQYLMLDLDPSNRKRFPIKFDEVLKT